MKAKIQPIKAAKVFFSSPEIIWLAPNKLVRDQLREHLRVNLPQKGGSAWEVPRLETFSSLEQSLAAELAPEISPLTQNFILANLSRPLAQYLWPGEKSPPPTTLLALAHDLKDAFDRFKLAGLTWAEIATFPPQDWARMLADLGQLYDEQITALGVKDRFSLRRQVIVELNEGRKFKALFRTKKIICQRAWRLSPFETDFLLALATNYEVEVHLTAPTWVKEEELEHGSGFDLLRAIRRLETSPQLQLYHFSPQDTQAPKALAFAAENLLKNKPQSAGQAPNDYLRLYQVPSAYHEVQEAARLLKQSLQQGVKPAELALVVPDLANYQPLIDDVARRFKMAFHFQKGESLATCGAALALFDLLDLWSSNWERTQVIKLITNPYFKLTDKTSRELHSLALRAGVTDCRAGGSFQENLAKVPTDEARELWRIVNDLSKDGDELKACQTWPQFLNTFQLILNRCHWPGDITKAADESIRRADEAATRAIKEELITLSQALVGPHAPKVNLPEFKMWLKSVLAERALSFDHSPEGRIRVLSYYDLHGGQFSEIFFLGLNAKVYPPTTIDNRLFPTEFTQTATKFLGRPLWNDLGDRYRQDELIFACGLAQGRRISLFYHHQDEKGRPLLPSPLLNSLMEMWEDLPVRELDCAGEQSIANKQPRQLAGSDELWLQLATLPPESWPSHQRTPQNLAFRENILRRCSLKPLSQDGATLSSAMKEHWLACHPNYENRPLLNAAQLGTFHQCPYRYWWDSVLRLSVDGESLEEWPPYSEGELLHRVLERFFKRRTGRKTANVPTKGPAWPGQTNFYEAEKELFELLTEESEKMFQKNAVGRKPLWQLKKETLPLILSEWLKREMAESEDVRPWLLEWSFGARKEDQAPPWALESSLGTIYFQGRADRIDFSEPHKELLVRDYKLSKNSAASLRKGTAPPKTAWPLLVYALAAARELGYPARPSFEILNSSDKHRQEIWSTQEPEMALGQENEIAPEMALGQKENEIATEMALGQKENEKAPENPPNPDEAPTFNFPEMLAETWQNINQGVFKPTKDGCQYCPYVGGASALCAASDTSEEE